MNNLHPTQCKMVGRDCTRSFTNDFKELKKAWNIVQFLVLKRL